MTHKFWTQSLRCLEEGNGEALDTQIMQLVSILTRIF